MWPAQASEQAHINASQLSQHTRVQPVIVAIALIDQTNSPGIGHGYSGREVLFWEICRPPSPQIDGLDGNRGSRDSRSRPLAPSARRQSCPKTPLPSASQAPESKRSQDPLLCRPQPGDLEAAKTSLQVKGVASAGEQQLSVVHGTRYYRETRSRSRTSRCCSRK